MAKGEENKELYAKHEDLSSISFTEAQAFLWRESLFVMGYAKKKMLTQNLKNPQREKWTAKYLSGINSASKSLGDYSLTDLSETLAKIERKVNEVT